MALQSYNRGIRDIKISSWTSENVFGAAYDVLGARAATLTWVVESDELRGDDIVLDRFTKMVSVTVAFEQAAIDLTVFDMILGGTLVNNANYYDLKISEADEVPYVAIAGRIVGSSSGFDLQFLAPKCKLAGNLQLGAQLDTYMLPSGEFQGVNEGTTNGMLRFRHYTALTGLEIPLRVTTGGV